MTRAEQQRQRQEWENKIAAYRSSGQCFGAWCKANGVKPHQLRYRLSQEAKRGKKTGPAPITWLRAAAAGEPAQDAGLRVRVGGAVIEVRPGFDPDLLAMVVRVLLAVC